MKECFGFLAALLDLDQRSADTDQICAGFMEIGGPI